MSYNKPYYNFNNFKNACGQDSKNVRAINNVLTDANNLFNLRTQKQLLDFIYNDGLEDLQFVNTNDWKQNPDRSNPIKIDAYKFRTMSMLGYIAFMYNSTTNKWLIKSFHLSDDRDTTMMLALQKAGLIKLENKNEK